MSFSPTFTAFDQYQRYHFIQRAIRAVAAGRRLRILEIGGAQSPLSTLVPEHQVFEIDRIKQTGLDAQADGLRLPFVDNSFDVVVSTDVLEHIPNDGRQPFLHQLIRVSSKSVIIGFPPDQPLVNHADRALLEFIKETTGVEYPFLSEHVKQKLPQLSSVMEVIGPSFEKILQFENSNLLTWLLMQMAHFLTASHQELEKSFGLLNDFFIKYFDFSSHASPGYRIFLFCFKQSPATDVIEKLEALKKPEESSAENYGKYSFLLSTSFHHAVIEKDKEVQSVTGKAEEEVRKAEEQAEEARKKAGDLDQKVKELSVVVDLQIKELQNAVTHAADLVLEKKILEEEFCQTEKIYAGQLLASQTRIKNLQDYLNLFLNHPIYKIYKLIKRSFGRSQPSENYNTEKQLSDFENYQRCFEPNQSELLRQSQESAGWQVRPLLNIVSSIFSPPHTVLHATVNSVLSQTYSNWVWNIVDASPGDIIWSYLKEVAQKEPRIVLHRAWENRGIAANTNIALRQARGEFIVMLDHDDLLAPQALYAVADVIRRHPDVDFIYSDADKLDESGQRCEPIFKPDWSPDTMLSYNLLNQLSVFRRVLLEQVGYLDPAMDGAQDWDLYFRISEKTDRIYHIPQILYHWRKSSQSTAQSRKNKQNLQTAQSAVLVSHLKRTGLSEPYVHFQEGHRIYENYPVCRWKPTNNRTVSIIIPSRDQSEVLRECLHSLFELTRYPDFEVVLVDTGSTEPETFRLYESYAANPRFRIVRFSAPFNFAKACNFGARVSTGDLILFLNNDTQVLKGDWLQLMVQWFERAGIGIVGCKLIYADGTIQHGGVILGMGGLASHLFQNDEQNIGTVFGTDGWYRNLSAVTAACMLISRKAFEAVNGFDERFILNYSDVDLCIRVRKAGYRILYTPDVRLIHLESVSHGRRIPRSDFEEASKRWASLLQAGDPYFNPNLSYSSANPRIKEHAGDCPSMLNKALMSRMPQKEILILPDDLIERA